MMMLSKSFELMIKELCANVLSEPNPQALPDKIICHVEENFPVEWCTLWVTEQKGAGGDKQLRLRAAADKAKPLLKADDGKPSVYDFGEGLTGEIAKRCETVNITKPADFARYKHAKKYDQIMYGRPAAGDQCQSVLGVPLVLRSKSELPEGEADSGEKRVIGVLKLENIYATEKHPETYFTNADVEVVEAYAAVIAVALEKAQMRADSIRIGEGLLEISRNLLAKLGAPPDLNAIARETASVISAEACALWGRNGLQLRLEAEHGYPGGEKGAHPYDLEVEDDAEIRKRLGINDPLEVEKVKYRERGLTVFVANSKKPLNLKTADEVKGHFAWKGANDKTMWDKPHGGACYSLVAIPLVDEETGDVKGVFKIENKKRTLFQFESYFTEEDQRLLEILGNSISLSLIIAERFDRLRRFQKLVSSIRVLDGVDDALFFILTGLTHGDGLQYNRAMVFLKEQNAVAERLVCRYAVGPIDHYAWGLETKIVDAHGPLNFDKLIPEFRQNREQFMETAMMKNWCKREVCLDNINGQKIAYHAQNCENTTKYLSGDLVSTDALNGFAHGDFVLIPIRIERELQGIIYADNRFTDNRVNDFECQVLDLFAGMAGAIIQASQVPERLRKESDLAWRMFSQPAAHRLGTETRIIGDEINIICRRQLERSKILIKEKEYAPIEIVQKSLEVIERSVERLRQATKDYQRLTPEPEESEPIEMCKFIQDIVQSTVGNMENLEPNLVFGEGPIKITARKGGLKYVFEELLLNALREVVESDDKPTIRVMIDVKREGDQIRCIVCDDGDGIPENVRDRVFREPVKGRPGGTGLGLYQIHRFLRDNGGTIKLLTENKPQGYDGACFLITLSTNFSATKGA
jgi:signal transduction histidine kinase